VIRRIALLGLGWAVLMALAGGEFLISAMPMALPNRSVVLLPAGLMVLIVVFGFMRLASAPVVARGFAVAAMFWLVLLLGLGSMDALTRHVWWVHGYMPK
jgi:purine-cytosine permease-like protein